ncbi:MAG: N-acetyltransferase [Hyphomonadaceae bacterium]|jgi:putative acetyltransferase|nr:N-acetyltransferase [Hyphomonadaceae bacterium]
MQIRDERPSDVEVIHDLTRMAFAPMPFSAGDEQDLILALRADNALALSLVAVLGEELVGHIAFSRVLIDGNVCDWFDLGPVSVRPELQSLGIGSALIRSGLERITSMGAAGCVLLGYPTYYCRFGFLHDPELRYNGEVNPNFQQLTLRGDTPKGSVTYHPAFYV